MVRTSAASRSQNNSQGCSERDFNSSNVLAQRQCQMNPKLLPRKRELYGVWRPHVRLTKCSSAHIIQLWSACVLPNMINVCLIINIFRTSHASTERRKIEINAMMNIQNTRCLLLGYLKNDKFDAKPSLGSDNKTWVLCLFAPDFLRISMAKSTWSCQEIKGKIRNFTLEGTYCEPKACAVVVGETLF